MLNSEGSADVPGSVAVALCAASAGTAEAAVRAAPAVWVPDVVRQAAAHLRGKGFSITNC